MWLYVPSEHLASARESGVLNSDSNLPFRTGRVVFVTSNAKALPQPASWRGWKTRSWIRHLSGLRLARSTAQRGVERWISSLLVSHANQSHRQDEPSASRTNDGSGRNSPALSRKLKRRLSSWRTYLASSAEGWPRYIPTYPRSGLMLCGIVYPLNRSVLPTSANGSSSSESDTPTTELRGRSKRSDERWPTPQAHDSRGAPGKEAQATGSFERSLPAAVQQLPERWPTPTAHDDNKSPEAHMAMKARMPGGARKTVTSLQVLSKMWPTPISRDAKDGFTTRRDLPVNAYLGRAVWHSHDSLRDRTNSNSGRKSSTEARGLNPLFVEWLMGFPIGWTDLGRSATRSFHRWLRRHGVN